MLKYLILTTLCTLASSNTFAQEGVARPLSVQLTPDLALRLPACAAGVPLYVQNNRLVCGAAIARNCPDQQVISGVNADGSLVCRAVNAGCQLE